MVLRLWSYWPMASGPAPPNDLIGPTPCRGGANANPGHSNAFFFTISRFSEESRLAGTNCPKNPEESQIIPKSKSLPKPLLMHWRGRGGGRYRERGIAVLTHISAFTAEYISMFHKEKSVEWRPRSWASEASPSAASRSAQKCENNQFLKIEMWILQPPISTSDGNDPPLEISTIKYQVSAPFFLNISSPFSKMARSISSINDHCIGIMTEEKWNKNRSSGTL